MKKKDFYWSLLSIIMMALLSVGISACGDDEEDPTLTVDKQTVSFSSGGGNVVINVMSNTDWSVTGGDSWLIVTKSSDAVNLTAQKNESTEEKTTTIIVKTDDNALMQPIEVRIEGAEQILELSGLDADFEKTDCTSDNAQELTITCNAEWKINGKPEWLSISNTSGKGNMKIKIWPNSVNKSTDRKATIIVSSGSKQLEKEITQKGISSAYAHPKDNMTLTESSVWRYDFSNELHHVYFTLMREIIVSGMTDDDILRDITLNESEGYWVRRTPKQFENNGNFFSWTGLEKDTKYTLISVAFDDNNEVGEINRMAINTKKDDSYNSPYIHNDYINASYSQNADGDLVYKIDIRKDPVNAAYADKFYTWAIASTGIFETLSNSTDAIRAYYMWREIKKNPAPHDTYVMGTDRNVIRERLEGPVAETSFTLPANVGNDKYMQIITWCTLSSGDFSGRINWCYYDLQSESDGKRKMKQISQMNTEEPVLVQFDLKNPSEYTIIKQ